MQRIDINVSDLPRDPSDQIAEDARQEYLSLFETRHEAIEFEEGCLAIGREFLPPAAIAVLDGKVATSDYWAWLSDEVETSRHEATQLRQ